MSKNQVIKQNLLNDLKKEYKDVMNFLDDCFHPLMRNEKDADKLQKLQLKYQQIGQQITADYLKVVEQICQLNCPKGIPKKQ